ncbi:glucose-1-phosphate thymidylyltransferase [Allostreptomyces psammosilenae]|uniref:Glucose-1-phosphate thymidylyltransferase n=1 Tax=Allostreptomyces psammosilenae TaxID=1892865 RepID=A0A852ZRW8_9ACTN|nr:glucose-1-phosphate thymidylyltransferase [Allostreptomyces psammosilenae]NYI04207.1 glucose-1-phosphate thymidylyltransferase [Allostreptomyces psammosilenae]
MKALVLAGGTGTRLRPFTHTSAKQLIPVAGKPVLCYGLEAIAAAGVHDVGLVVGDRGDEVREVVGDGARFGLRVTYVRQERPLGIAHALLTARDFLGEDDFLLYLGDTFVTGGLGELAERFRRERPDAQLLLSRVPDPTAFGVAELDESGEVLRLEEKPERPRSDLALVGVYFFTPAVHEAVRAIRPSARGELEITHAVQEMIERGLRVRATVGSGYWRDTGSVEDLLEVNRLVLEDVQPRIDGKVDADSSVVGRVRIAEGAVVRGSRIVGPVIIGAGAVVTDSYVGPHTSIGEGCRIDGSGIEYSVVLRDSRIDGVRLVTASLIGRNVTVTSSARPPGAQQLLLGDHSTVRVAG